MDEMETHHWGIFNEKYAVVLNKAVFRWDKEGGKDSKVKIKDKGGAGMKGKYKEFCMGFTWIP